MDRSQSEPDRYVCSSKIIRMPKLTLSVDAAVVERAKAYAREQGTSVSALVEKMLDVAAAPSAARSTSRCCAAFAAHSRAARSPTTTATSRRSIGETPPPGCERRPRVPPASGQVRARQDTSRTSRTVWLSAQVSRNLRSRTVHFHWPLPYNFGQAHAGSTEPTADLPTPRRGHCRAARGRSAGRCRNARTRRSTPQSRLCHRPDARPARGDRQGRFQRGRYRGIVRRAHDPHDEAIAREAPREVGEMLDGPALGGPEFRARAKDRDRPGARQPERLHRSREIRGIRHERRRCRRRWQLAARHGERRVTRHELRHSAPIEPTCTSVIE